MTPLHHEEVISLAKKFLAPHLIDPSLNPHVLTLPLRQIWDNKLGRVSDVFCE